LSDSRFKRYIRTKIQSYLVEPTVRTGPIFISTGTRNDNRGNQFYDAKRTARELWKRQRNEAQYGNVIINTINQYLSNWICGNGANIEIDGAAEKKWLKQFLEINQLDSFLLPRITRGANLEGASLLYLQPHKKLEETNIRIKYLPWINWNYEVVTKKDDSEIIEKITFTDSQQNEKALYPKEIVYVNFDNSGYDITDPVPPLADILTDAINIDRAKADFRSYNHLWAVMGPHFEAPDIPTSNAVIKSLDTKEDAGGYEFGDVFAAPAKCYFPEPSGSGTDSMVKEIDLLSKNISGRSGVPVHLLGHATQLSNRATAEELKESITAVTAEPRDILEESIKELIRKAVDMQNAITKTNLSKDKIYVKLTQVSQQQIKELIEVYLPLSEAGYISDDQVRSRIPGIDAAQEKRLMEKEKESNMNRQREMIDIMRNENNEQEDELRAVK
jgi:hypothetical protein